MNTLTTRSTAPITAPVSARLALAKELLEDIESSRLETRPLLMKAVRLADLVGNEGMRRWLKWELGGYDTSGEALAPVELVLKAKLMQQTGRSRPGQIYAIKVDDPLPVIEGKIPSLWAKANAVRDKVERGVLPEHERHTADGCITAANSFQHVLNRVMQMLHEFAVATYHRLEFGEVAESIFEQHAQSVDAVLQDTAPDVIEKIPAVYERLTAGDEEAVGHALNTCRRMIWDFVDRVAPPREPVVEDGVAHPMNKSSHMNRIEQLLKERCTSGSRRERLNRTIRLIHERVSAGIKKDIDASEGRSLFLATYLTLGEIAMATAVSTQSNVIRST